MIDLNKQRVVYARVSLISVQVALALTFKNPASYI
jgi:hypothetical protein